jgi:hypothetical protein
MIYQEAINFFEKKNQQHLKILLHKPNKPADHARFATVMQHKL